MQKKHHAIFYLAFVVVIVGLYVWYVRGVSFSRVFGTPVSFGDAARGQWMRLPPMPTARTGVGMAVNEGKIYVIGGIDGFGQTVGIVEIFDPILGRWESAPALPHGIHHTSVVSLDGYVYAIGGFTGLQYTPSNEAFVFDPITGTWQMIAPLPEARGGMGAVLFHGKIAVVGGRSPDGLSRALFVYDPENNKWDIKASMKDAREYVAAAYFQEKMYVVGGQKAPGNESATTEIYDPATDSWQSDPSLPRGLSEGGVIVANKKLLFIGGKQGTRVQGETFRLNMENKNWDTLSSMMTPRQGFGVGEWKGIVYVFGGGKHSGISVSDIAEQFVIGE